MWWAGSSRADVYIGSRMVAWCLGDGEAGSCPTNDYGAGVDAATAALPAGRRLRIHVWLSARLAPPFVLQPTVGVRNWNEQVRIAEAEAPGLTGLDEACHVWLEAQGEGHPLVGAAVPQELLQRLHQSFGAARGWVLVSVRPWWSDVLRQAADQQTVDVLRVDEPDAMTLLGGTGAAVGTASAYWPTPAPEQAASMVERFLINAGLPRTHALQAAWRDSRAENPAQGGFPASWSMLS